MMEPENLWCSVVLSDSVPPQNHPMRGCEIGADFFERKSDVVVQRGTIHAWENRSDKVARMAFFHVDAQFSEELLAKLPQPLELMR
jgi:hypothetical protein